MDRGDAAIEAAERHNKKMAEERARAEAAPPVQETAPTNYEDAETVVPTQERVKSNSSTAKENVAQFYRDLPDQDDDTMDPEVDFEPQSKQYSNNSDKRVEL